MAFPHVPQDLYQFRNFDVDTNTWKITIPDSLPQRPAKFNSNGREISVTLNTFNVVQAPNTVVHQYDVSSLASTLIQPF